MSATTAVSASASASRPLDDWLSINEAAAWLKVGPRVIYNAIRRGELRATPINQRRDFRLHRSWVIKWMQSLADRG